MLQNNTAAAQPLRNRKQVPSFIALIFLATVSIQTASAEVTPSSALTGIGLRNQTDFSGSVKSSMLGGAEIFVRGEGMADMATSNFPRYVFSGMSSLAMDGDALTDNESFMSMPSQGKLAISTPSLLDLFGATWQQFDGRGSLQTGLDGDPIESIVQVTSSDFTDQLECASSSNCKIKYERLFTPFMHDIVPSQVYAGQRIDFWFDIMNVHSNTPDDYFPVQELSIGRSNCDWEGLMDHRVRLSKYTLGKLPAMVTDPRPTKSADVVARFVTGHSYKRSTSYHCGFDGTDCFYLRVHPKIESISASSGSTNGYQTLQITGQGLNGTDFTVTADNEVCVVKSATDTLLTCETSDRGSPSSSGDEMPGQMGLVKTVYDPTDGSTPGWGDFTGDVVELSAALVFETTDRYETLTDESADTSTLNDGNYEDAVAVQSSTYLTKMDGWFKAPSTNNFRFYMSCDDECKLEFDETNYYGSGTPADLDSNNILERNSHMTFRSYQTPSWGQYGKDIVRSDYFSLQEGRYYRIRGQHKQASGNAFFTVSLEVQGAFTQVDGADHPKAQREIQSFEIDQDQIPEKWIIEITSPSSEGGWFLAFIKDNGDTVLVPEEAEDNFTFDTSASNLCTHMQRDYFNPVIGSSISCSRVMTDELDAETSDFSLATKITFTIELNMRIEGHSFASVDATVYDSSATILFEYPANEGVRAVTSSAPLGGHFTISCEDPDTAEIQTTWNLNWGTDAKWVAYAISENIKFLATSVIGFNGIPEDTADNDQRWYWQNYRRFYIEFYDYLGNVPQCTIQSATDDVANALTGLNPSFSQNTIQEGGTNLFFEPIPSEMLYTSVSKPQVLVTIDEIQAACANADCDYEYVDTTPEVTSQDVNGLDVTIGGTDLPTTDISLIFGGAPCGAITGDSTSLSCTLDHLPYGGDHSVELYDSNGLVNRDTLSPINVPLDLTGVTPDTELNRYGGDLLTFSGNGFPNVIEYASLTFADGTECVIQTISPIQIECIPEPFDQNTLDTSVGMDATLAITVPDVGQRRLRNLKNLATPPGWPVNFNSLSPRVTAVTPSTLSPVLKGQLTFTLADYTTIMQAGDFEVSMVQETDSTFLRLLNVVSVDDSANELTVQFPGAASGTYTFKIKGAIGSLGTEGISVQTLMELTDYSPKSGSTLGGTRLTLTGRHFGTVATDNPVKVGNHYCYVIATADTEITCRIGDLATQSATADAALFVFARTTEEMVCNTGDDCMFEYAAPTSTATGISSSFDTASNSIHVTVSGSGFGTDTSTTSLLIDNIEQTTVSVADGSAVFQVTDMLDSSSSSIKFYTYEGTPNGQSTASSHSFTPALVSVSPNTGSSGGAKLTITGVGFGTNTASVNVNHVESGQNICSSTEITAYGQFTCYTIAQEIQASDTLKLVVDGSSYDCANTDDAQCQFEALDATSPTVATITKVDSTTLEFTGVNLVDTADSINCNMLGVTGTGVSSDGQTKVTCTFAKGIPATDSEVTPTLVFVVTDTSEDTALTGGQTISNPLTVVGGQSGLTCSFEGGCHYNIEATGLASTLAGNSDNSVTVCNQRCEIDLDASDADNAKCTLPALMTTYSAAQFEMAEAANISGTWTGSGSSSELAKLNDGKNLDDYSDSSTPCYYQISADDSYVFQVDEVKVFINNLLDRTPYDANLRLQGSDQAQETWTDLYTYTGDVHEGWYTILASEVQGSPFSYNTFRFYGEAAGSCRFGEVQLIGLQVLADAQTSSSCTAQLTIDGSSQDLTSVTYSESATPYLDAITPRYGSEKGSETVVFTGAGFSGTPTVLIDGRACAVVSFDSTSITCTTADKPTSMITAEHPSLVISIEGVGRVATRGMKYRYVARWSDTDTWGGDFIPGYGDAVEIPEGRALLYDVDSTPQLSFITVMGALIFAPETDKTHHRTFDAQYVIVNGGYLEIGTEEFPYDSRLTITMHGDEFTPALPIYGNKVIAVRNGRLEMHGPERSHVWTELETTASAGATSITLVDVGDTELDWQVGEEIVIASTDFVGRHAEQRTITGVSDRDTNPVITFAEALEYKHYAGEETFGDHKLVMRAEVGLLSRNVKYRGDPETSALNQYGAHIMLASPGNESVVGKIENCEFFDVGQAFKLGRYPLHFHMIGTVTQSYIRNNAIHQTYNRATTLHGVHYLTIQNNVAYKVMGHAIFIEDAAETKNLIDGNLVVDTRASNSLLNTDQTPASFWITHPDNIFRNNHAAGSDRYSYWFDLQVHSTGPSFDVNICPENSKLGEFKDNVAHSNGRYGLRIFHQLVPRQKPCQGLSLNRASTSNPFGSNEPIIAKFENLVSYKNGRNGAISERVGAVQFHNFIVADNKLAGMEFSDARYVALDDYTKVVGGLVVGRSANTESDDNTFRGIIGPRSEWLRIEGTSFYNLPDGMAALGDCSHCWHPASTDMGARTITTKELHFDASAPVRIRYQYPFRGIFWDLDGTLTRKGENSYATFNWQHNLWAPACTNSADDQQEFDGIICDNTVQIRQIYFDGYSPSHFDNQDEFIAQLPLSFENDLKAEADDNNDAFQEYIENDANFSQLWMVKNIWAAPFVTGKRYNIRWGTGLDFEDMKMHLSDRWSDSDFTVYFHSTHIDVREEINFYDISTGNKIANMTYFDEKQSGANFVYNDTDTREFGWRASMLGDGIQDVRMEGVRCINVDCDLEDVDDVPISDVEMLWSLATTWPDGNVPTGPDVEVPPGYNIIYDLEDSPLFDVVTVNGRLTFLNDPAELPSLNLNAKHIFVRAGELLIGSEAEPYQAEATITLHGARADAQVKMSGTVEAGNKIIANTNLVEFYGKPRDRWTRLEAPAHNGATQVYVGTGLDWDTGDKVYFAPTNMQPYHHEYREVADYDATQGVLTLTEGLDFYHYGGAASVADDFNGLDMRGEVILLSRNVRVVAEESNDWGCTIVTADRVEADRSVRTGTMILKNVEVYKGGQEDTYKSAIRYEGAARATTSMVENSVAWGGNAKPLIIKTSKNITVKDSTFLGGFQVGIMLQTVDNVHLDGVFLGDIKRRFTNVQLQTIDKEGGIAFCSFTGGSDRCPNSSVQNSIVAGVIYAGYIAPGHECGDTSSVTFRNNVAHSIDGTGAHIYPNGALAGQSTCYEGSHFSAYKNRETGLTCFYGTSELIIRDMLLVDNHKGVSLNIGKEGSSLKIRMHDSEIFGEVEGVNEDAPDGQAGWCADKHGLMIFQASQGGKPLHPTMPSSLPIQKIKSNGSWGGDVELDNVNFNQFKARTECGAKQHAIKRNPTNADYTPLSKFKNTKFRDVQDGALIFIDDPNPGWANPTDCGEWPCTAPNNIVLQFENAQFTGLDRPAKTSSNFVLVSDVPTATNSYGGCSTVSQWNAAHCVGNQRIGVLLFESLDADTSDRTIQPITLTSAETGYENRVNSFMDHVWDGFYTGQKRLSRFPIQIETDHHYLIHMAGTPPQKQRYTLRGNRGWVTLRLYYPNAGAYQVYARGQLMPETAWDTSIGGPGALTKSYCGEWRFIAIQNFLEFYLESDCEVEIEPLDQIRTTVRLSWTLDEFYADGGTTTFTDRVAASLGIPAWRIKTVAVYEGSVIVLFDIISDVTLDDPLGDLQSLGEQLVDNLKNLPGDWLGAPILDVDVDGQNIIQSSDLFDGNAGTSTLITDWLAERDGIQTDDSNTSGGGTTTGGTSTTGGGTSSGGTSSSDNNGDAQSGSSGSDNGGDDDQDGEKDISVIQNNVTINTDIDVDIQNELATGQLDNGNDNNFVIVILIVIVCAILIIAGFFIVRLLMTKRQRKFVVEEMENSQG